jgi:hypothetical protein
MKRLFNRRACAWVGATTLAIGLGSSLAACGASAEPAGTSSTPTPAANVTVAADEFGRAEGGVANVLVLGPLTAEITNCYEENVTISWRNAGPSTVDVSIVAQTIGTGPYGWKDSLEVGSTVETYVGQLADSGPKGFEGYKGTDAKIDCIAADFLRLRIG